MTRFRQMDLRAVFAACLFSLSLPVQAGAWSLSGNAGIGTDYLFRGVSLLDDGKTAQIYGGLDLAAPLGFFAGAWVSNSSTNTEVDLYAGWAFEQGDWRGDVYAAGYLYPQQAEAGRNADTIEYVAGIGWKFLDTRLWVDPKLDTEFIELNATISLPKDLSLVVHTGYFAAENNAAEYFVGHLQLNWQGYSLLVSQTDIKDENPHVVISHTWNFSIIE